MSKQAGFSLIELLVCLTIIAVLAALLLPTIGLARGLAGRLQCAGIMRQAAMANLAYTQDNRGQLVKEKTLSTHPVTGAPMVLEAWHMLWDYTDFADMATEQDHAWYWKRQRLLQCPVKSDVPAAWWNWWNETRGGTAWIATNYLLNGKKVAANDYELERMPGIRLARVASSAQTCLYTDGWAGPTTWSTYDFGSVGPFPDAADGCPALQHWLYPNDADKHRGSANYVFVDGHVAAMRVGEAWRMAAQPSGSLGLDATFEKHPFVLPW